MTNKISEIRIKDELIKLIKSGKVNITKYNTTTINYMLYGNDKIFHCYDIAYITDVNNSSMTWEIWRTAGIPAIMVVAPNPHIINGCVPIYNQDFMNVIERELENAIKSKNQDDSYENFLSLMDEFNKINKPVHSSRYAIDLSDVGNFIVEANNKGITVSDFNGHDIFYKAIDGHEEWIEYDKNNNCIHFKTSDGYEECTKYNEYGDEIYFTNSTGLEWWMNNNGDKITKEEYDVINAPNTWRSIDLSIVGTFRVRVNTTNITLYDVYGSDIVYKECTPFEYHREYNDEGQCIHYTDSNDVEEWYNNGKCIHCKDSTGENWYNSDGNKITKEEYDSIHKVINEPIGNVDQSWMDWMDSKCSITAWTIPNKPKYTEFTD